MWKKSSLAVVAAVALVAVAYSLWSSQDAGSAAGPLRRVIIPGVASDTVPVTTTRQVVVHVELEIKQPSFKAGATTLIEVRATAHGPLPGPSDPPVTVPAHFEISTHPGDACAWDPVVNGNVTLTYSQPQGSNLQIKLNFSGAEWYYQVECGGETIRFPHGSTNESLTGWLGLIVPGLYDPALRGAIIDTPPGRGSSDPDCIKRTGFRQGTGFGGKALIWVFVTDVPCLIEAPPQNPAYDPGGF